MTNGGYNDLEEVKYEVEEEQQSTIKNILGGIPEKYFFLILVLSLVAIYMVSQGILTMNQIITYIGLAIVAILFMSYTNIKSETYLNYREAVAISETFVKEMQRIRKIPSGVVNATILGRLRKQGSLPNEYTVNIKVRTNDYREFDYEIIVDPKRNGLGVIGCIESGTGYDPLREPEIKYYPTAEMFTDYQKKYFGETGRFPRQ